MVPGKAPPSRPTLGADTHALLLPLLLLLLLLIVYIPMAFVPKRVFGLFLCSTLYNIVILNLYSSDCH